VSSAKTCPRCGATYGADVIFCPNDRTVLDQSAGQLTGQIIAERYRVISRIGEGGMGEVFLAEHVHMKRKCAVKLLNPELAGDAGALKRFMREAANASRIDHPNVVTIYDFGEMPNRNAFLAMEFIEGESLRKRIERQASMPRDVMASIVRQTASALQAAHVLGIVHRDLKPDNIMLVEREGELRVKVVDFGIAKAKSDKTKVTATGAIVGTPDYMSPEQLLAD
jgi:serine/threonine protein kinase